MNALRKGGRDYYDITQSSNIHTSLVESNHFLKVLMKNISYLVKVYDLSRSRIKMSLYNKKGFDTYMALKDKSAKFILHRIYEISVQCGTLSLHVYW